MMQTETEKNIFPLSNPKAVSKFDETETPTQENLIPEISQEILLCDLIVQYLEQLGIEFVFGIPGGAIEPFFDALARSEQRGGPKIIVARHETGSAFMADGYYYHSGKLGVCCATTGPGVTNLITGVASAYANHIPLLVISAQTPLDSFGKGAFQESSCTGINILAMLDSCTRFNSLVSHPDQLESKLISAITMAFGPVPGPVHLSIPLDVMKMAIPKKGPLTNLHTLINVQSRPTSEHIEEFISVLSNARKSVFIIGEGANQAMTAILQIARYFKSQIITTPQGKGLVNGNDPLYRGVIGFAGHQDALEALSQDDVDTVICIGSALNEWSNNSWDEQYLLTSKLVHIDQFQQNFSRTPMARMHIYGTISRTFDDAIAYLTRTIPDFVSRTNVDIKSVAIQKQRFIEPHVISSTEIPIHPARLMQELPKILPTNTFYIADIGSSFAWAIHYLNPAERRLKGLREDCRGLFRTCVEFSSMGWAIGCSIGSALARPKHPVACITGDGSVLMNGQEITVAVQEGLPIVFIVLNDSALGMVKHGQRLTGAEPVGYSIPETDFSKMAEAMGVTSFRIKDFQDLDKVKEFEFGNQKGPILLDVLIDPEAQPPIQCRTNTLKQDANSKEVVSTVETREFNE